MWVTMTACLNREQQNMSGKATRLCASWFFRNASSWRGTNWFVFPCNRKHVLLIVPSMSWLGNLVFTYYLCLIPPVSLVHAICWTQFHLFVFECHLQVAPSLLNYFVFPHLSCLWAFVSVCTPLCTHTYLNVCDCVCLWCKFFLCVYLACCLSDSRCGTLFLSVSWAHTHPNSLSPFFYHPFTLPHPHPLSLPPLPSAITVLT